MRHSIPRGPQSPAMVLAVAVVALAALAGVAARAQPAAAKGEVHFDPDSPAGKEYALPLDQARAEATGDASDGASGEKAPLFGVGVSGRDPRSEQAPGRGGRVGGQREIGGAEGRKSRVSAQSAGREVRLSTVGDGYPLTRGIGLVAAIVLLGGVLALALRRTARVGLR